MTFPARIAIVGSGTAGWLAALMLQDGAKRAGAVTAITLIESSKFGTIGVGEGTTAVFRMMLRHLALTNLSSCVRLRPRSNWASATAIGGGWGITTTARLTIRIW